MNPFGHIDLRVADLAVAATFYGELLPALGFRHTYHSERWLVWAADVEPPGPAYFAVTEDRGHVANQNRIAFHVASPPDVDRVAAVAKEAGARIESGPRPCPEYGASYYAVFFEDPRRNRLEVFYRMD
jgi:catechol 2,3-dioxygenase-like lactoylglutathione lyase family enzyme